MSEQLARRFHEIYERLAPSFGYETRTDTRQFDPESKNGKLMIAVCGEVCDQLITERDGTRKDAERYRWLRSEEVNTEPRYYPFWQEFQYKLSREGKMDALIDAAMASRPSAPDVTAAVIDSPQAPLE